MRAIAILLCLLTSPSIAQTLLPFSSGPATTGGNPTVGVLQAGNDAYANWTMAGLQSVGGIPHRTTQCGSTLTPSGGNDTTQINNAIAACTGGPGLSGQFVLLGSGTFQMTDSNVLLVNKSVTLRGSGPGVTTIAVTDGAARYVLGGHCTNGANGIGGTLTSCTNQSTIFMGAKGLFEQTWAQCNPGSQPTSCPLAIALDADAAQGATTIQVHGTSNFSIGMWVLIDEASNGGYLTDPMAISLGQVWASSDAMSSSSSPATGRVVWQKHNPSQGNDDFSSSTNPTQSFTQGCAWSFCDRPTAEIHHVTAIGAGPCPGVNCTLTFDSPLTIAYRQSAGHNAQVYWPTDSSNNPNPFVEYAGLENLTIERTSGGPVDMAFCAYCWVQNVEMKWWLHGVGVYYSVRSQIDTTYNHDCADSENSGVEYPIDIQNASTEIYVVNNIITLCGKGMTARGGGAGSVVAYNLFDQTYYLFQMGVIGNWWVETTINFSHSAGSHHMLAEGNWAPNMDSDDTHGSVFYQTYFRNWATGFRSDFTDPSDATLVSDINNTSDAPPNGPLRTAGPMAYLYWFAHVGNVHGTSGQSTTGNGWVSQGTYGTNNKMIWLSGWLNWDPNTSDTHLNTLTTADYIQRHAYYDYRLGSVVNQAGYSTTIPNSFYLASKPAFFGPGATCTYPWPWVTPSGASQIQANSCSGSGLPAKARYDAGTPFVQP